MALRFFRQLYSLDTLDTRFVVPATVPPKEALEETEANPTRPISTTVQNGKAKGANVGPPRWKTPEFMFYYVSIGISVILMFKGVLDVSKCQYRFPLKCYKMY